MVQRVYTFKDGLWFQYAPRPGTDRVIKPPTPIGTRFKGLNATFAARIDAAVNWGDGFVYLFNGDEYWKYDALRDRTTHRRPERSPKDGQPLPRPLPPQMRARLRAQS